MRNRFWWNFYRNANISVGFLHFRRWRRGEDEEEEEEEEEAPLGEMKTSYKENPKYDPVSLTDLVDGSMSFWVHHTLYILPQGKWTEIL